MLIGAISIARRYKKKTTKAHAEQAQNATEKLAKDFPEYGVLFWSRKIVAKVLGLGQSTVSVLVAKEPTFPQPVKLSGAVRWKASEIIAWAEAVETKTLPITGPITPGHQIRHVNEVAPVPKCIKKATENRAY